jgi:NitT/TauT family transport system substrate-binding protein
MSRRLFLQQTSALSTASLLGFSIESQAEPQPETNKIRLVHAPAICLAPQYIAEELLRMEGFSEISYVHLNSGNVVPAILEGRADMTMDATPAALYLMDSHPSLVALAGIHAGCYELFGHGSVRSIRDLKGKTISIYTFGGADHILISSMLAYVGMIPQKDVNWITGDNSLDAMRLFIEGKSDAFMGFAPQPEELRAKKIGQVILNTTTDRPWSQYYCCMLFANREFVASYPVATKRAIRAYLKAADICAKEPERVARFLAEKGYEPRFEVGLAVVRSLPYRRWREANPEDTLRFLALRLHEVGMIKSTPQQIIDRGSNFSFLNELKKELKA